MWALAKNRHRWKIQLGATLAANPFLLASCPIGAVQAVIGSSKYHFAYYVVGFLLFIGVLLGRVVCGFLCPFG